MIKNTIKKLIEHSIYTTFKLLSKLPNKNLIYFESFHGKQYSDNPKALYEYLTEHSDAQLIWGVKKDMNTYSNSTMYHMLQSFQWNGF